MNEQAEFHKTAGTYLQRCGCIPDGEVFFTHSSLLWPVIRDGRPLMLKIVRPDDDERHAAEILKHYNGEGAVALIDSEYSIQLLERIVPTSEQVSLEEMVLSGQDDKATNIICDVIQTLHRRSQKTKAPLHLIPFSERSETMRRHLDEGRVGSADMAIFLRAQQLIETLSAWSQSSAMPLHGDIHHFNILHSAARGWLAIDPKGIHGPRAYEYANSLCNPYMHTDIVASPERLRRQAQIISSRANINTKELLNFTFLHACQCAAWSLHEPDQFYWLACARTAEAVIAAL